VWVSAEGLDVTGPEARSLARSRTLLELPFKEGARWNKYGGWYCTARGPERVVVPAGEFLCIRVEEKITFSPPYSTRNPPSMAATCGYAKGVGLVKRNSSASAGRS
jgi:hypothetical protein